MIIRQAMIWINMPDPGRTEAAETVSRDITTRKTRQSQLYLLELKYSKL